MHPKTTPPVFLRAASGLTKSAGTLDVFIYNVGLISIGIGVIYTHLMGPANYPGGDIAIASLLAMVVMLFVGAAYWFWTMTLPRSGGIYVFVSRGLSPPVGFALSFVETVCWLFYNAVAGVLFATVGLASWLTALGMTTGNPGLINAARVLESPLSQFLLGALLIILSGLLLISGTRRYFLVQKVTFVVAVAGTLLMVFCLAYYSRQDFIINFNRFMGTLGPEAYDKVIGAARQAGWRDAEFGWWQTLRLSVWPFLPLIGGAFSISIGGEVRQVGKAQGIGMLGAIVSCGVVFALVGYFSDRSIGYEFQGAVAYNALNVPEMSTPTRPYFVLLLHVLVNNLVGTCILAVSFIAWIYFWVPGILAYAERAILAWSFDRLTPDSFGYVSDRYHTPVVAIMLTVAVSLVFLYLYVYTTFFATLIFILAAAIAWLITTITGIFFPYRSRDLYEMSPAAHYHIKGVPLMSVMNFFASLGLLLMIVLLFTDPVAAGHDFKSLATITGVFALGIVWYYVMKFIRKRQGIDVTLAFKQIPIE
ncbi:MAG TPA: amino acid permease [Pyrinomonadaceae bacterium]